MDNPDIAPSPTDAAGAINAGPALEGALKTVARLASTVVPDIDDVGVVLTGRRGRIQGQGPGLRAMKQGSATESTAVRRSERSCR